MSRFASNDPVGKETGQHRDQIGTPARSQKRKRPAKTLAERHSPKRRYPICTRRALNSQRDQRHRDTRLQRCDWTAPGILDGRTNNTKRKYIGKRDGVRAFSDPVLSWIVVSDTPRKGINDTFAIKNIGLIDRLVVAQATSRSSEMLKNLKSPPPPHRSWERIEGAEPARMGSHGHNGREFDAWCQ